MHTTLPAAPPTSSHTFPQHRARDPPPTSRGGKCTLLILETTPEKTCLPLSVVILAFGVSPSTHTSGISFPRCMQLETQASATGLL
jgi:hypothetical protein